jgi:dienelactone hydrolase
MPAGYIENNKTGRKAMSRKPSPPFHSLEEMMPLFDYDSRRPLQATESVVEKANGVVRYDVSYAGLDGERISAYWIAPDGTGPFSSVVYVHPGPGDRSSFLEEGVLLGHRGVAALLVEAPWARGESWARTLGAPEHNREVYIAILRDLRRGVDFVASRPEVDPARIGYVGHSLGALCGGVLSAVERRARAFVLMAGAPSFTDVARLNMPSLQGEALQHYARVMAPIDPLYYVEKAAPAALFFQFGRQDIFFSRERFKLYAEAGSEPKLVRWYDADHYLQSEKALQDRVNWLVTRLK